MTPGVQTSADSRMARGVFIETLLMYNMKVMIVTSVSLRTNQTNGFPMLYRVHRC